MQNSMLHKNFFFAQWVNIWRSLEHKYTLKHLPNMSAISDGAPWFPGALSGRLPHLLVKFAPAYMISCVIALCMLVFSTFPYPFLIKASCMSLLLLNHILQWSRLHHLPAGLALFKLSPPTLSGRVGREQISFALALTLNQWEK